MAERGEVVRSERATWAVAVTVPVAAVLVGGWQRRWISDDGFINFRVIDQVLAGHGPVFNQGERVEVTTSTLWPVLVAAVHVVTRVRLEWVAVACGLACTALAVVVGLHGARHLHRASAGEGRAWWLPAGAVAFAAVPVVWDFTTGGLENGMSWLWWAAAFALAVQATVGPDPGRPEPAALVIGLGPLVRPDLALPALVFLALVLAHEVPRAASRRDAVLRVGLLGAVAGAAPGLYQLFRMGYYGQLLPNTVYAKEGGTSWWSQGWRYLGDLVGTYWLWVPAVALVGLAAVTATREGRRADGWLRAVAMSELAALSHALLVVRAGGDYMHGRLLLPALLGLLLPVFALPLRPDRLRAAALPALLLGTWAVLVLGRQSTAEPFAEPIFDNRRFAASSTGVATPVLLEQHLHYLDEQGVDLDRWGEGEPPAWSPLGPGGPTLAPLAEGRGPAVSTMAIGALPYALPLDVYVADGLGLADPVVAHVRLPERGIPGHEKSLRLPWWAARLLAPGEVLPAELNAQELFVVPRPDPPSHDPEVVRREQADAADALACRDLARLTAISREPLTLRRFAANLVRAPRLHAFRFDPDPAVARRDLCD